MQKGIASILVILLLTGTALLFIPFPYYQNNILCFPGISCPKEGWYLGDPLWKKIFNYFYYINKPTQYLTTVTSPSATPSASPEQTDAGETANWKTYRSQFFFFKYPQDWVLNEDKTKVSLLDPKYSDPNCKGDCPVFSVSVNIQDNSKNLSLETIVQNNYKAVAGVAGDYSKVKIEDFIVNGLTFKKLTGIPGGGFYQLYIFQNNRFFIVSPAAGVNGILDDQIDPKVKAELAIFDQILSTFKFTQ